LTEQRIGEALALLFLGLGGAAVGLRQHELHHPFGELRVAPEDAERLVEDRPLFVARKQHRRHGPVPVFAPQREPARARHLQGLDAVHHPVGADAQPRCSEEPREVHHVFC